MVESACNVGYLGSIPRSRWSPGGGHSNPLRYSFLPGESYGQRSLVDYSPWVCKELTQLNDWLSFSLSWLYKDLYVNAYSHFIYNCQNLEILHVHHWINKKNNRATKREEPLIMATTWMSLKRVKWRKQAINCCIQFDSIYMRKSKLKGQKSDQVITSSASRRGVNINGWKGNAMSWLQWWLHD